MGIASTNAIFTRKMRRGLHHFLAFVLAVSTLSAISVVSAPTARAALTNTDCSPTVSGLTVGSTVVSGNDCIITFTAGTSGTWTTPTGVTSFQTLVNGGGGGGGAGGYNYVGGVGGGGGGGGGGGSVSTQTITGLSGAQNVTVTVGAGGSGGSSPGSVGGSWGGSHGRDGSTSSLSVGATTVSASGGIAGLGGGSWELQSSASTACKNNRAFTVDGKAIYYQDGLGGRGGNSGSYSGALPYCTTGTYGIGQTNAGVGGSGGGGAGSAGSATTLTSLLTTLQSGGSGTSSTISGSSVDYGTGGSGGLGNSGSTTPSAGAAGSVRGMGGTGGTGSTNSQVSGTSGSTGGAGASGVVIVRFTVPTCSPASRDSGGYTYLTFTSVGMCSWSVPSGVTTTDVLVVGGGGGGAANWSGSTGAGGSGGGGGVYTATAVPVSGTVAITVGAGGAAGVSTTTQSGRSGSQGVTSAFGTLTAGGGGGGGCETNTTNGQPCPSGSTIHGLPGTAGGNGGSPSNFWNAYNYGSPGAASNVTIGGNTYTAVTGYQGGIYDSGRSVTNSAGSAGGAGGAGAYNAPGAGVTSTLTGSTVYGKGGSSWNATSWDLNSLSANTGFGGNGGYSSTGTATNGVSGSSGIVVVRYANSYQLTVTQSSNGTISPSTFSSIAGGSNQTFTFTPSAGFNVSSITIDGTALTGDALKNAIGNGYTFSTISASHTVTATYSGIETTGLLVNLDATLGSSLSSSIAAGSTVSSWSSVAPGASFSSIGANSLTASNGTAGASTPPRSVYFDGTGSYINFDKRTNNSNVALSNNAVTIETWINLASVSSNDWDIIASKWFADTSRNESSSNVFHFGFLNSRLNVYARAGTTGTCEGLNSNTTFNSTFYSKWVHVAFTIDATGNLKFYVNGVPDGAYTGCSFTDKDSALLIVGDTGAATSMNGSMSRFKMYNVALTATQIQSNFTSEANIFNPASFIEYEYNSATGSNTTLSSVYASGGTAITLPVPTRTNYTFGGWYESSSFTGSAIGSTYSPTQSRIIYAKWVGDSKTITYAAGTGGSGSAPTTPTSVAYGSTFTTPTNTYTKSGYTFTGWSDGSSTYAAGATYPASGSITTGVTLTAQWTPISVTITTPTTGLTGTVGTSYSLTLSKSGGSGSGTFTLPSGSLPTGVTLNASTGEISGTPTAAGTFAITARITDTNTSVATTSSFSIVISSLKLSTPASLAAAAVSGTSTSITVTFNTVSNASSYKVQLFDSGGTQVGSDYSSFTSGSRINGLTAATAYSVKVIAVGDGTNYTNSDASSGVSVTTNTANYLDFSGAVDQRGFTANAVIPTTGTFTVEAWISPNTYGSTKEPTILSQGNNATAYFWFGLTTDGKLRVYRGNGSGTVPVCSANPLPTKTWSHVAVSVNGATAICYVNGVAQTAVTIGTGTLAAAFYLGALVQHTTNTLYSFSGQIDEVKIWNTVRTQSQISTNMEVAPISTDSGLVAYYPFDATTGTDVTDIKGTNPLVLYTTMTWLPVVRTVTYAAGDNGSGSTGAQSGVNDHNSSITLKDATSASGITRSNYIISAWNTSSNGTSGTSYELGASYLGPISITLYPTWTANTHTITYAAGTGGSGSAPTSPVSVNHGATFTTPSNTYTKTGYTFAGWSDGTNTYAAGATYPSSGTVSVDVTLTARWTADTNTITYDNQSATTAQSGGSTSYTTGTAIATIPTTAPLKTGYTFAGWFTASSGGSQVTNGSLTPASPFGTVTLYAQWTANTLTVTYDSQGGTSVTAGSVATGANLTAPTAPTKAGYTFSGWSITSTGSVVSFSGGYAHGQTASFTLYAIWSADSLTVTFDSQGGSSVTAGSVATGANLSAPTAPTKAGYIFSGWSTTSSGSVVSFTGGYAHGQTASFTLYAIWSANTLTVTYDSQGGISVSSGSVATGANLTAPTAPTKAGYTFSGWSTTSSGSVVSFTGGYAHGQTANFTLYAIWSANALTVTYDSQGGTSVTAGSVATGANLSAPTAPTKTGYTFSGWSTTSAGSVVSFSGGYAHGQTASFTLYAIWVEIAATVYFHADDYTAGSTMWTERVANAVGTTATGGMTKGTSPTSVVFAGKESSNSDRVTGSIGSTSGLTEVTVEMWVRLDDNGSTQSASGSMLFSWVASAGTANYNIYHNSSKLGFNAFNSELYGINSSTHEQKWKHLVFVMSTGSVASQKIYVNGVLQTLGYEFNTSMGTRSFNATGDFVVMDNSYSLNTWNAKGKLGLLRVYRGELNGTQITALYGATKSTYELLVVTYDSQGGSSVSVGSTAVGGSVATAPTPPTRTGYTFAGWSTTSSGSAISFTGGYTHGQSADFTLYAIWAANALTITYDSQSGSAVAAGSVNTGASISAAPTAPTRTGYTFSGWSTTSSGSVVAFPYTHGQTANFTLYAIWAANALTVTYDSKGGTAVSSGTVNTAASISSAPTAPTRTGYTFSAWSATDGGTAITFPYAHGQTANFTLYAIWAANALTITYDSKSGTAVSNGTVNTGASISAAPTAPTKTGYTLSGWSATDGGAVVTFPYAHGNTANFTMYAIWSANTLTITYDEQSGSSIADGTVLVGASISAAPTAPIRAGYSLTGWSTTSSGSVVTFPYSHAQTDNFTLYAIWAAVSCSPTSTTTVGYTIYTFTTAGTCFWTVPAGVTDVEVLAVAGGGGGGYAWDNAGAGGGAGGQLKTGPLTLSTTLEVTVGAGGSAGVVSSTRGGTGGNSVVSTITALGGTGGCSARATTCSDSAQATSLAAAKGGAGGSGGASGKGGGGSNTAGSLTSTTAGGTGTASTYSGSSVTYGVGGTGGTARAATTNIAGTAGSANTGNGGGGASAKSSSGQVNGGAGGTGLVVVRVASALTVTYDSQSGSPVSAGSTLTGASISSAPTPPTRSNYSFVGWFTATTGGTAISFPYTHGQTADFTLYARWTLNTYAIAFNANNGLGTMANQSVIHGTAANLNANLFTRANYVFYRWATAADGTGTTYSDLAQVTLTAGTTLYAQWTANTYVVTYAYNSATGGNSTTTSSFNTAGTPITLPIPTRTGYTFGGWYSEAGLSSASSIGAAGATYSPTGATLSLSAYAKWTAVNYTFTYDANSADIGSVPTETSKQITQTATIKANTGSLTRAGYTFGGWNTQSNGSGTNYLSGAIFTVGSSDVTLYAKWSANTYTVTYNSNSGSGSAQRSSSNVASDDYTTGGSAISLPAVGTLQRAGYTFAGWNTSAAGTGTTYAAADNYTTVSNTTLYAKWNAITYAISYNGNTSTGGSTPTTGGYTTGQASPYSVASNTFTKSLHVFGGWNTVDNGSGTNYSPGSGITTLADVVLYAIWIPQYTLHYAINGGSISSGVLPADTLYNSGTSVGPVFSSVSRTGYTFGGWANGVSTIAANGSFSIVADSVLTAIWTPINYSISYNSDGGTEPPASTTKQINQSHTVGSAPTKPGYNFTGWSNGSSVVGAGAVVVTGASDVTYTAQWVAKVYTISYDWNGGRGTAVSDVNYTFGTTAITLPLVGDRVKDGYTFAGWSESSNGSALNTTYIPSQTRTLYALWNIGNFTITYDPGRGTVANTTVAVQNGLATVLPLPTRSNFTFNGWHTAVSGGSSVGSNGSSFTPTSSQTVYARWIQNSLYGITDSLNRIGTVTTSSNIANTFSGANSNSSVAVSIPANALPAGTTINFDLVSSSTRATGVISNINYLVSIALSWLTGDETVPDTASDKPITVTISNASIKAGAAAYAIVNNVSTLLGTATQDGVITVSITSDPEIVVAATRPGAPTSVAATSNGNQQSVVSWTAPSSDGGSAITGYTVTANTGATCTTSTTSCTISSLTNGTAYTFTVTATNIVGTSVASSSASATTAALYAVTFDAKGGSAVTSGSFLTASTVSEPTAPTRTGYSFAGWAATDGGSAEVFPYAPGVTAAITMYARWDALDNAVTFDSKGGSSVTATVFSSGGTVAEPTAPTKNGYTFAGWSATDGGNVVTFPYAPGVVTDITLYAKWSVVSQSSSGGGGGGSSSPSTPAPSEPSTPSTPVKSNVTVVAPVTVVGDQDAKVIAVEITTPAAGSTVKPPVIKVDKASEKFIAEVKVVDGKLVLTPETGFSGKKTVTVTITENGSDRFVQIPLTVLPEAVTKPVLTPTSASKTIIRWTESPNADAYTVYLNGKKVCSTSALSCSVRNVLGPDARVEIVSNGGDRTVSDKVEADFKQVAPVQITRLVSSTNIKSSLTSVDTKALDKVIALIKNQGFGTIVISNITTTKKTEAAAAARIAAIKKYIDAKTGSKEIAFEVVPAASRTYFNNIAVKG